MTMNLKSPTSVEEICGYTTWAYPEVGRGLASDACDGSRLMGEEASTLHVLSANRARSAFDHAATTDWLYNRSTWSNDWTQVP